MPVEEMDAWGVSKSALRRRRRERAAARATLAENAVAQEPQCPEELSTELLEQVRAGG